MARHAPPVRIQCASPTVSGESSAPASTSVEPFIASKNQFGCVQTTASNLQTDPNEINYMVPRVCHVNMLQPRSLWQPSSRATWVDDYTAMNTVNPLCLHLLHQAPFHNTPGFRTVDSDKFHAITTWAQSSSNVDRNKAALSKDGTNADRLHTNSQTATTNKGKQAGWTVCITDPDTMQYSANIATDALTGSDLTGEGFGSGDVSAFMVWMHDGSMVLNPKSGAKLLAVQSEGFINTIINSNSKQPIEVRLSNDVNLPTTGNLTSSSSYGGSDATGYGATDEVDAIWFLPPGNKGFIGFHVIGYKAAAASRSDVFLKELPGTAHSSQMQTPAAGWRYVLNDQTSGGEASGDWDRDGTHENPETVESFNFAQGLRDYFDLIATQIEAQSGVQNSFRVWNSGSGSHVVKRGAGLNVPHAQQRIGDIIHYEDWASDANFDASGDIYDCSNTRIERMMRGFYFGKNFIRTNQGGLGSGTPRGSMFGVYGRGVTGYQYVSDLDASFYRFYWGAFAVDPTNAIMEFRIGAPGYPRLIEECWIDLDTNWASPDPLGSYNEAGGTVGSSGFPTGQWTWSSGQPGDLRDNGRRIYIRKLSSRWLLAINMADAPSGYNEYAPSHLAGGFTPRNPQDIITPADFSQLVSDGVLSPGYSLHHYNPGGYVNQRVTDELVSQRPSVWTGFKYGPRQAHPDDSNNGLSAYTLSNLPAICRDSTLNDGSTVNTSHNYALGPMEAVVWEIS